MIEIRSSIKQVDFNNLTYGFKNENLAPINFIKFKGALHIYKDIVDGGNL